MMQTASMRGYDRAWRLFVTLNVLVLALLLVHVIEEMGRGALDTTTLAALLVPIFLALTIGAGAAWLHQAWGLGMALAGNLWLTFAAGISHLMPGSPDHVGAISATYGGAAGVLMAAVAALLWLAALVTLVQGVWMLARGTRAPARRPTTV